MYPAYSMMVRGIKFTLVSGYNNLPEEIREACCVRSARKAIFMRNCASGDHSMLLDIFTRPLRGRYARLQVRDATGGSDADGRIQLQTQKEKQRRNLILMQSSKKGGGPKTLYIKAPLEATEGLC